MNENNTITVDQTDAFDNSADVNSLMDESKIVSLYESKSTEAKEILDDEDKVERMLQKLEHKFKVIPVAGTVLAYIPLLVSLVRSYVKKEYTELPLATVISIVAALVYVISPIDLIPDSIPGIGQIDDGIVLLYCLSFAITDLDDYQKWRKEQGLELIDVPDYEAIQDERIGKFVEAILKKKKPESDPE